METIESYLEKTASATKKLFEGVDEYIDILKSDESTVFISDTIEPDAFELEYARWEEKNREAINRRMEREKLYLSESFALANLCGALLQNAAMGLTLFAPIRPIPEQFIGIIDEKNHRIRQFCGGRIVCGVPIGLIILAGRNQYNHIEDGAGLRNPNKMVFKLLADMGKNPEGRSLINPAFDLSTSRLICYASNITALLGWRNYDCYVKDMLLLVNDSGCEEGKP